MAGEGAVRPFATGTQYADWDAANCQRCTKASYRLPEDTWPTCPIEAALTEACLGDGTVTADIAQRMGYRTPPAAARPEYVWRCPEWEAHP